jgi:ubiquinone biosynthesis protein
MRHLASPHAWGPALLKGASDWAELVRIIPRVSSQVLTRVERGEMEVTLSHKGLSQALARLDQLANRLSLSILLAALIVGLALLVPVFNLGEQWNLATIVVIIGFVGVSLLSLWLIFSIWRSSRK